MLKFRKLLMASLIAVMATAPSAVMAAAQITKQAEQPWCGNTTTPSTCAPSKPVVQFDETGFPLLDPADVTRWCDRGFFGGGGHCIGEVQEAYDIAKYKWQITFESAHPDDTQIALKETAQQMAGSGAGPGGRDNLWAYYRSLGGSLERRLEWHRRNDPRGFKP